MYIRILISYSYIIYIYIYTYITILASQHHGDVPLKKDILHADALF
jgi:hypothetical protein